MRYRNTSPGTIVISALVDRQGKPFHLKSGDVVDLGNATQWDPLRVARYRAAIGHFIALGELTAEVAKPKQKKVAPVPAPRPPMLPKEEPEVK